MITMFLIIKFIVVDLTKFMIKLLILHSNSFTICYFGGWIDKIENLLYNIFRRSLAT